MFQNSIKLIKENPLIAGGFLLTLLVYSRFLFFGPISWDDPEMVFKNEAVKNFDVAALFTNHYVGNYIPLTMLFHSVSWFLFENNAAGHHSVNIILHLLNGFLVFKLSKKLFANDMVIALGTLVFLLHPLQIESVGWISELKNVLSTTFYLLGLYFFVIYRIQKQVKHFIICFILFAFACLSKSSVVVFPFSLVCIDLLLGTRITLKKVTHLTPFFVVSFIFGWINIQTQTADLFINHAHEFPLYQRFGFAGFAILKYIVLFLAPFNLSVIYPYPDFKWSIIVLGFLLMAAIISLFVMLILKKNLKLSALILFVLVNLILVLQFLPFGEVLYADRYAYVPIVGFSWMLGYAISHLKIPLKIVGITLGVFFSIISFARAGVWKNSLSLYENILQKYPQQFIALNSAGVECMFQNEDKKALDYFNRAVKVAPNNYKGFYNRGLLLLKNGNAEQAIVSFNQTLNLYDYVKAYVGRAAAYYLLKDIPKAMADANKVLAMDSENAKAYFILGNCYSEINKLNEALFHYNKAISITNSDADFYFKRAIVYGKKQEFENSLGDLKLCLSLNSEYFEAYYWMGVAKVNLKQDPCADFFVSARHNFEPGINAYNTYCR